MTPEATIFQWVGINAVVWGWLALEAYEAWRDRDTPEKAAAHIKAVKDAVKQSFPPTS